MRDREHHSMDPSTPSRERDQSRILVDSIDEWKKVQASFTESMVSKLDAKVKGKTASEKAAILGHLLEVGHLRCGSACLQAFTPFFTVEGSYF